MSFEGTHSPGEARLELWREMERLMESGAVRAIGVSNFESGHLEPLLEGCSVAPAVNQIEVNPLQYPRSLISVCERNGIAVEAYSPLAKGAVLRHPIVCRIAESLSCTPAQLAIAWGLRKGFVSIPKVLVDSAARLRGDYALILFM